MHAEIAVVGPSGAHDGVVGERTLMMKANHVLTSRGQGRPYTNYVREVRQ